MSLVQKIPKNWLFETDTESKICLDPGSTETVSRYFPALLKSKNLTLVEEIVNLTFTMPNTTSAFESMSSARSAAVSRPRPTLKPNMTTPLLQAMSFLLPPADTERKSAPMGSRTAV